MSTHSETSINIPQLLIVLFISGLAIRYFFFSGPSTTAVSSSSQSRRRGAGRAARPEDVEQIASMFPQVGRREIMWDLQRNGGSVAATSERILAGLAAGRDGRGGLEVPPPSFQPPSLLANPSSTSSATATTTSSSSAASKDPTQLDLIQRYNLASKLSQAATEPLTDNTSSKKKEGWSNNKSERQALLQRRREEMILNARRKLEEEEERKRKGKGQEEKAV